MKWGELKQLQWKDLQTLSWFNLSEDKLVLLDRFLHNELSLSPSAEKELRTLCLHFVESFEKRYHKKITFYSVASFLITVLSVLGDLQSIGIDLAPELKQLYQAILNSLFEALSS